MTDLARLHRSLMAGDTAGAAQEIFGFRQMTLDQIHETLGDIAAAVLAARARLREGIDIGETHRAIARRALRGGSFIEAQRRHNDAVHALRRMAGDD